MALWWSMRGSATVERYRDEKHSPFNVYQRRRKIIIGKFWRVNCWPWQPERGRGGQCCKIEIQLKDVILKMDQPRPLFLSSFLINTTWTNRGPWQDLNLDLQSVIIDIYFYQARYSQWEWQLMGDEGSYQPMWCKLLCLSCRFLSFSFVGFKHF